MEKMIKRLLSVAIALAMVLSWLPANVLEAEAAAGSNLYGDSTDWTVWTGSSSLTTGNYKLEADVDLAEIGAVSISSGKTVAIDLCGHTITAKADGYTFSVVGKLIIQDSSAAQTGKIVGGTLETGGANIRLSGEVDLYSGTITGGYTGYRGGNIYVSSGTFNMYGGAVTNGYATDIGGNIYVTGPGYINVHGGEISGGSADAVKGSGGNVGMMYSHLTMSGGIITGGAAAAGSNLNLTGWYRSCTMTVSGGTVGEPATGNTGNSINVSSDEKPEELAAITISGGTLLGKTNIKAAANVTLSGEPTIADLALGKNVRLSPAGLTGNASITVSTEDVDGILSVPLDNAQDYQHFFTSKKAGYGIGARNSVLVVTDDICVCGCGAAASAVEWKDFNTYFATASAGEVRTDGHYYLSGPLTLTEAVPTIEIYADVALDLRGYTITPTADRRTIFVNDGYSLTVADTLGTGVIYGATLTGTKAYGGTVNVAANAKFALRGGVISGGSALLGGNIFSSKPTSTIEITGGAVVNGHANNSTGSAENRGGNIYSCGTLLISGDARVIGGRAHYSSGNQGRGGNIFISNGNTEISGNAKVYNGVADKWAGNIMVSNTSATLTISGNATVAGGKAANAADNIVSMYSTVNIADKALVDAGAKGGCGVSVDVSGSGTNLSKLHISGGTVYGKFAVGTLVEQITISGAPVIKHLSLATGKRIDPTGMTTGASVTVEPVDAAITDTLQNAASYVPYFRAYTAGKAVVVQDDQLQIAGSGCVCGCGASSTDTSVWQSWTGEEITESGHYQLSTTMTLSDQLAIGSGLDVILDLNGHTLSAASGKRCFRVTGGKLTIMDSVGGGQLVGGSVTESQYGGTIYLEKSDTYSAKLNLYSGTITGGSTSYGGNIHSEGSSQINIYGGTISGGNATERGGNIYAGSGTINIYGGTITAGYAGARGGNIFSNTTLWIAGGTISDGTDSSGGGNIYSTGQNCPVYVAGGTITGGNIGLMYSNLYISGGTISGGSISASASSASNFSKIMISGGTVSSNITATGSSYAGSEPEIAITGGKLTGAVNIKKAKTFVLSGAPTISKLTLGAEAKLTVKDLSESADITIVSACGVFTNALENAEAVKSILKYSGSGTYEVSGNALAIYTDTSGNLKWAKDADNILVIAGTGAMSDYGTYSNKAPWGTSVEKVYIESGVTSIGKYAFYNCKSLTDIHIPTTVKTISQGAFRNCTALANVYYEGSQSQFNSISITSTYNTPLTDLKSAGSIHYGEASAAAPVTSNTSWSISGSTLTISGSGAMDNYYYDSAFTLYKGAPWKDSANQITSVVISSGVTSVGAWAFANLKNLTSVSLADSVTCIANNAFRGCEKLQTVNIGNVTKVGNSAFYGCTALKTVTGNEQLETIESYAFYGCSALESITGVWMIEQLGDCAFLGCTSLTELSCSVTYAFENGVLYNEDYTVLIHAGSVSGSFTVPATVTEIKAYAFAGNTKLTSVTIGDSVTTIGGAAFDGCTALETVSLGKGVTAIATNTFANCDSLTAFSVSESNTAFAVDATGAICSKDLTTLAQVPGSVTEYVVSEGVTAIGKGALMGSNKLTNVTLSETTATIDTYAFACNDNLESITVPAALTKVGQGAFEGSGLTHVYYPDTLSKWSSISVAAYNAPFKTAQLHYTLVAPTACGETVTWTLNSDGVLTISGTGSLADYAAAEIPWIRYQQNIKSLVIEDGVTAIGANAFNGCAALTDATISYTVNTVGENAFANTGLTNVAFGGSKPLWDTMTVGAGNELLTGATVTFAIVVAQGIVVTKLPTKLDYNMGDTLDPSGLEVALLYHDTTTEAIRTEDCTVTGDLSFPGKRTVTVAYGDFETTFQVNVSVSGTCGETLAWTLNSDGLLTITGSGRMDTFANVENGTPWHAYKAMITAVELPEGLLDIQRRAFENCANLTSIVIPASVTSIAVGVFRNSGLTSVTIQPGGTKLSIGNAAFAGCTGLTEVVLPDSVTTLVNGAFHSCSNLETIHIGTGMTTIETQAFRNCGALKNVYYAGSRTTWSKINISESYNQALLEQATIHYAKVDVATVAVTGQATKLQYNMHEVLDTTGLTVTLIYDDGSTEETDQSLEAVYDFSTYGTKTVELLYQGNTVYTYEVTVLPIGMTGEVTWMLDAETGTLLITGIGAMADYTDETPAPWATIAEQILSVQISDEVTAIGQNAFVGCANMASVSVPESVTAIGSGAFSGCTGLTEVYYAGTIGGWNQITVGENNEALAAATLISAVVYGDADGDGRVSTLDATLILQKVAGWDVETNLAAADADGDGRVSTLDATLILQKVAGWDVTLGPQQ